MYSQVRYQINIKALVVNQQDFDGAPQKYLCLYFFISDNNIYKWIRFPRSETLHF